MCFEIITMKQKLFTTLFVCAALAIQTESYAQGFLKKLKDKVEKSRRSTRQKVADKTGTTNVPANNTSNTNLPGNTKNGRPVNKSGEGLKILPYLMFYNRLQMLILHSISNSLAKQGFLFNRLYSVLNFKLAISCCNRSLLKLLVYPKIQLKTG